MQRVLLTVIISIFILGFTGTGDEKNDTITRLKANLEFLASDETEGRYTGAHGERIAGEFIASEFKKYGITPFGDGGSYFQSLQLATKILDTTSTLTLAKEDGDTELLNISKDFAVWGGFLPGRIDTDKKYEMIYAGFGITAEEFDYDDYATIDIDGKVVIFHFGEPFSEDADYFNGAGRSQYSNTISKIFLAASKNAAGIIVMMPEAIVSDPSRINRQSFSESMCFPDTSSIQSGFDLPPVIYMFPSGAKKIFTEEKSNDEIIIGDLSRVNQPERFELNTKISLTFSRSVTELTGRNVVGIIEGNDPKMKDEYVVLSAHYDHLGMRNETVFNGADDNASGTVAVMEIMRRLAAEKNNARSIIGILYTGEEKGLFGSTYFVNTFKPDCKIVANINIDMCGRKGVDTLFCVGSDLSSPDYNELIKNTNAETVNFFLDYSKSNYEFVHRSDLAPFYDADIPMVDFGDDMQVDYHRPSDDVDKINYEKIYKTAKFLEALTTNIANLDHRLKFSGKL